MRFRSITRFLRIRTSIFPAAAFGRTGGRAMEMPAAFQFVPGAIGESIYSSDGEPYIQLPRSVMGKLSRRAQLVADAIIEFAAQTTGTNARDQDLEKKTDLNRRTIQRALQDLEAAGIELIKRWRSGGRRVIELTKQLLDQLPKPKPKPATKKPAAKPEPSRVMSDEETRRERGQRIIDAHAVWGWEPRIEGTAVVWDAISGVEPREVIQEQLEFRHRFMADVRAIIDATRPARE